MSRIVAKKIECRPVIASRVVKPLSLRRNFSWTLLGNVVYAGCQWAILVVLAKLATPEMLGRFALGLAVTAPVAMLANLALRPLQATDARGEYDFGHYLALRCITTPIAIAVIVGIAAFGSYPCQAALVIVAVGLAKAFESFSDAFYGLMQRRERLDLIARSMLIKSPLSVLAMAAAVWTTGDVFWGAAALAATRLLVLVGYDAPSASAIMATSKTGAVPTYLSSRKTLLNQIGRAHV